MMTRHSANFSPSEVPVKREVAEEAFENYLFERMVMHDGDAAHLLVHFRASMTAVPERPSGEGIEDPSLMRRRTAALWEGLRRVNEPHHRHA